MVNKTPVTIQSLNSPSGTVYMKNTKLVLTIGLSVILSLMILIATTSMLAYQKNLTSIKAIVKFNNLKVQYITKMRTHARERTLNMQKMLIYTDPFERDEEWMRFKSHASNFITYRDKLLKLPLLSSEIKDIKALAKLAGRNGFLQNTIAELILADKHEQARVLLIKKSIPLQDQVFEHMSVILNSIEEKTGQANLQSDQEFHNTVRTVFVFVIFTVLISLFIIRFLIKRITATEQQLFREKERAEITLYSIGDGAITTDANGNIEQMNETAAVITCCDITNSIGKPLTDVFQLKHQTGENAIEKIWNNVVSNGNIAVSYTDSVLIINNTELAIEYTLAPIFDSGKKISGTILIFKDVSELRSLSTQLVYQAQHDELTGLFNRREFEFKLNDILLEVRRNPAIQHWLSYIDLDQFKVVNDTCGHLAGDELLKQVSATIKKTIRDIDHFSRLGGDEFTVILKNCDYHLANTIIERIRETIQEFRFCWEDKCFSISSSIGLIEITEDAGNMHDLMSKVDAACYLAKDQGRNRIHLVEAHDTAVNKQRGEMNWVHRIRYALDHERFVLYYQSIKSLHVDNTQFHAEVLVRLFDDEDNLIPPNAFIPAAERYNLMTEIDRWVVKNTFKFMNANNFKSQIISINLSAQSLCDKNFSNFVITALNENMINPGSVCFEITETAAISNLSQAKLFIHTLREIGCKFSLDDFGSGLSSFGYLKNLKVDYLKIDGAFVKNIIEDKIDLAMVNAINQVGHTMGIKTIAEYVENREIENLLKSLDIDYAQGFGIHKPTPISTLLIESGAINLNSQA